MLLYILSALAVAVVGTAFTFWMIRQMEDSPPKTSKKRYIRHLRTHSH